MPRDPVGWRAQIMQCTVIGKTAQAGLVHIGPRNHIRPPITVERAKLRTQRRVKNNRMTRLPCRRCPAPGYPIRFSAVEMKNVQQITVF